MEISVVSPETFQRNVAPCPRSIVRGSASNKAIDGRSGFGGSTTFGGGGGGAAATGVFFLHPAANKLSVSASRMTLKRFRQLTVYPMLGAIPPENS
jgi:hypothetical protein